MTWLLIILGAMVAGFVQGLTGFAFALIAMSFWVWVLPPQLAAPLLVFASIWSSCDFTQSRKKSSLVLSRQLVLPYLVAGLIWRASGYLSVAGHSSRYLENDLGISFWCCRCPLVLLNPQFKTIKYSGKLTDSCIGFYWRILGGLGGFCGAIP